MSDRIPKTLSEKICDLDHHLFLLRQALIGLASDPAYVKSMAAELRVLVCRSDHTEGLLWRLTDEMNICDSILLEAVPSVNRDHPLNMGLSFATIPLNRPGQAPLGIAATLHSLREIMKSYEAVHLSSITDKRITHEYLIKAVAQQIGSAHEDDGIEMSLMRLKSLFFNGVEPYIRVLAFDSQLVLQVGERILDHCERVTWRPNDTSDWRFKRYQLNQGSCCCSLACFCSPETPEGDRDGLSTEYGQVVINQVVTRHRDV